MPGQPHPGLPSLPTQLDPALPAFRRPEIQATVKSPAVRNFRMAVTLYYIFAMSLWILVTVIGYWYNLITTSPVPCQTEESLLAAM